MIVASAFMEINSYLHMGYAGANINGDDPALAMLPLNNLTVRRKEWLHLFLSNEINMDMYFRDLSSTTDADR